MSTPKVTIVIPVWNGAAWLATCLDALAAQSFRDFTVIVVDNGSTDDSRALVARHAPQATLIALERNRGFAAAVNAGIRASRTEYVALLNMDTRPRPDWLANLVQTMDASAPDIGGLASKMLVDDRFRHCRRLRRQPLMAGCRRQAGPWPTCG